MSRAGRFREEHPINVVGIDVAGARRGFHLALAELRSPDILELYHAPTVELAVQWVRRHHPQVVAIDCPPRALIAGPDTRKAERELHSLGHKVQWTRRMGHGHEPQEWMLNGQKLWESLSSACSAFPHIHLIETFPTVVSEMLDSCEYRLPLRILGGKHNRKHYKDFIDASLCAFAAIRFGLGKAKCHGEGGELGPIWC